MQRRNVKVSLTKNRQQTKQDGTKMWRNVHIRMQDKLS